MHFNSTYVFCNFVLAMSFSCNTAHMKHEKHEKEINLTMCVNKKITLARNYGKPYY